MFGVDVGLIWQFCLYLAVVSFEYNRIFGGAVTKDAEQLFPIVDGTCQREFSLSFIEKFVAHELMTMESLKVN